MCKNNRFIILPNIIKTKNRGAILVRMRSIVNYTGENNFSEEEKSIITSVLMK